MISYSRRRSTALADAHARTGSIASDMRSLAELTSRVKKSLSYRERTVMEVGLRMAHAEEAIAAGDVSRAKAHGEALDGLLQQLGIER